MAKSQVIDRDRGWKRVFAAAYSVARSKSVVRVGVLDEGAGAETEPGGDLTVAEIAAVLEFGTEDGRIPERSFVRSTFDEQRTTLEALAARLLQAVVFHGLPEDVALGQLGALLASAIKAKVTSGQGVPPPNAPSTMLAKANTGRTSKFFRRPARNLGQALAQAGALAAVKTLIDTGRMLGAITWSVAK